MVFGFAAQCVVLMSTQPLPMFLSVPSAYVPAQSWTILSVISAACLLLLLFKGVRRAVPLIWSVGLVLSLTLTQGPGAGTGACQPLPDVSLVLSSAEVWLNVLLLVPLGLVVGFWSRPATFYGLAVFTTLTFVVEGVQLFVDELGRTCQVSDLVANTLGLFLGWVLARGIKAVFTGLGPR